MKMKDENGANFGPGLNSSERAIFEVLKENPDGDVEIAEGAQCESNGAIYIIAGECCIGLWVPSGDKLIGVQVANVRAVNEPARVMLRTLAWRKDAKLYRVTFKDGSAIYQIATGLDEIGKTEETSGARAYSVEYLGGTNATGSCFAPK